MFCRAVGIQKITFAVLCVAAVVGISAFNCPGEREVPEYVEIKLKDGPKYMRGFFAPKDFSGEGRMSMALALRQMRGVSLDVCKCLDEVYGTRIERFTGEPYPSVYSVRWTAEEFLSMDGEHMKATECAQGAQAFSFRKCRYHLYHTAEGSWQVERWAAETESLYREAVFGYAKVYDRSVPTPELYAAGKVCIERYR